MRGNVPYAQREQVVNALRKLGFTVVRIHGSHHMMRKAGSPLIPVPVHRNEPIADGTLRNIIRKAGLTLEEFYRAV
jgi:predicted RNA binding protein YcfA (HicA-like mRNA interferase family)